MKVSRSLNQAGDGVALIVMPFVLVYYPSISVGLLKSVLLRRGIACDDYYFNLEFAKTVGVEITHRICSLGDYLIGDLPFSREVCGGDADDATFFDRLRDSELARSFEGGVAGLRDCIRSMRETIVPAFIDRLVEQVDWRRYSLVGFTSTFQQHAAPLALAKRITQRYPDVPIVLGGANVHGEMGLAWIDYADFVDYVCLGEGDETLPLLYESLRDGRSVEGIPNLAFRRNGRAFRGNEPPTSVDIGQLPFPDYDTYFDEVKRVGLQQYLSVYPRTVPVETSRGCWWGQRRHCVFCGLNNLSLAYRSKTPERAWQEVSYLGQRYRARNFQIVDNILDPT